MLQHMQAYLLLSPRTLCWVTGSPRLELSSQSWWWIQSVRVRKGATFQTRSTGNCCSVRNRSQNGHTVKVKGPPHDLTGQTQLRRVVKLVCLLTIVQWMKPGLASPLRPLCLWKEVSFHSMACHDKSALRVSPDWGWNECIRLDMSSLW